MKKAFDDNVSRAKPRLRLGAFSAEHLNGAPPSELADQEPEVAEAAPVSPAPGVVPQETAVAVAQSVVELERAELEAPVEAASLPGPAAPPSAEGLANEVKARVGRARPRPPSTLRSQPSGPEVLPTPAPPVAVAVEESHALDPEEIELRRNRLKQRLKAVRENPRPEPIPATVAEAGEMAVGRISSLQAELGKVKALNLALTQDLEATRRKAERSTEEARLRMDEARRLSAEMEARAGLLTDLEKELESLEGERDEALLSLQESRRSLDDAARQQRDLVLRIDEKEKSLAESLSEEERLADELVDARAEGASLRDALDALKSERDTLAHQVEDLTRERTELLEARKALESVHRALAHALVK